nr:DUF2130 domain-containing protein [Bradyrhizobium sp. 139]
MTLRQGLLEVASARMTQAGQHSKADQVYQYLTGSRFKQRIEAIVERFKDMREDIDKQRKFMVKAWAKREAQVSAMIESTVGMVGQRPIEVRQDVRGSNVRVLQHLGAEGLLEEHLLGFLGVEDTRDSFLEAFRHLPLSVVRPVSILDQSHQRAHQKLLLSATT